MLASASSTVSSAGSSSYSISTSAAAASAVARLVATTAATRSPTKRTRSLKSVSSCGARSWPGWMRARQNRVIGEFSCQKTLTTPGIASAREASTRLTMPCGMVLRMSLAWSMPGMLKSLP